MRLKAQGTLWVVYLALLSGIAVAGPFRNVSNVPFASRCNGPQGAIVIDDSRLQTAAVRTSAVQAQHSAASLAPVKASFRRLQRAGLNTGRFDPRFPRTIVHTRGSSLVLPDLVKTQQAGKTIGDPTNQITFAYSNWSDADRLTLQSYLATAYPKARLYYGPPAFNITVTIVRDDTIKDIQGGTYDVSTNEIHIPSLSDNVPEDTFVLLLLVLKAFRDDAALFYDAWEDGMAGAAATAIQVQPGVSPGFDPKDPGPLYGLSVYEPQNHPALGNSTFYPSSGFTGMLVWRIAMARAAWLKCWIEDSTFFARFNQAYYNEYTSSLAGDTLRLREIAGGVLPTVEGMDFQDWFVRQYVLDTSVRAGLKEFTWNIPLETAVALICEHYLTDTDGNESPRSGQARTVYWSYDFSVNLYAEEGNLIDISATGETPGEGFLIPTFFNIGGAQRVTVQLDLNGLRSYYPFPYGVRGFDASTNNLYGAVLNTTSGTMDVTGGAGLTGTSVSRGVWGGRITVSDLSPLKLTATFTNGNGQTVTRQVNVGWDSYMIVHDGGAQNTLVHTFTKGVTGLQMMSLPLTPLSSSAATVLGIPSADLLLASWDPSLGSDGKYRVWPDCEPFSIGTGFWLRLLNDVTVTVSGVPASTTDRVSIPLKLGWNMFGSPRQDTVQVDALKIQVGTDTPVTLAEAVTKRYVQVGIFGYTESAGYQLATEITPFSAYWIRTLVSAGCRLVFEPVTTTAVQSRAVRTQSQTSSTTPGLAWKVPIVVQSGWVHSDQAYLGGVKGASAGTDALYDMQAPPAFGPVVTARFLRSEQGVERAYLTDVRQADAAGQTWTLEVTSTLVDQPLRVSWPDLSSLPAGLRPVLVDATTGTRVYMRTTPGYLLPATSTGVKRRLQIEMSSTASGGLVVTAVSARSTRSAVGLAYTLSRDASVSVRALNIAGRQVRRLTTSQVQTAGANSLVWNLSDDRGTRVPSGLYLMEIVAQAEDGQSVRVLRAVPVSR